MFGLNGKIGNEVFSSYLEQAGNLVAGPCR